MRRKITTENRSQVAYLAYNKPIVALQCGLELVSFCCAMKFLQPMEI